MKSYPSIPKALTPPDVPLYTFDKIDGSNLRFEWTRKRGWWKFGTRERLFDETDKDFGSAIGVFKETMAEPLTKYAIDNKWEPVVAFVEFAGARSFAGLHHPEDQKHVYLLDVSVHRVGILDPRDFLKVMEKTGVKTPAYLGHIKWNRTFLEQVAQSQVTGITLEGAVGKVQDRHKLLMWKTKTQAWKTLVQNKFETAVALKLIES